MKISSRFYIPIGITFLTILFLFLKIPSLVEPNWYIDEGLYSAIAHFLSAHAVLYKGVWDNKPPSIYYLFLISRNLFSYSVIPLRIFGFVISIGTIGLEILLIKEWFKNANFLFYFISILGLIIFNTMLGNQIDAEVIFIFFTLLGFYLLRKFNEKLSFPLFLLAGFILGIGISFKITAIFDVFAYGFCFLIFSLVNYKDSKNLAILKKNILCILGFGFASILPLLMYLFYFLTQNALSDYLNALLFSNTAYVSYFNNIILGINTLYINTIILFLILGLITYLYIKKCCFRNFTYFIIIWFFVGIYSTLISGRAYPHYLLQVAIPSSILLALLITKFRLKIFIPSLILFVLVLVYFVRNINSDLSLSGGINRLSDYYGKSYGYVIGKVSADRYYSSFNVSDNNLNVNNELSLINYVNTFQNIGSNKIYIWGNLPWVYASSNLTPVCKYLANFYISNDENLKEYVISCLQKQKPEIIIDENGYYTFDQIENFEKRYYTLEKTRFDNSVRIYKLTM